MQQSFAEFRDAERLLRSAFLAYGGCWPPGVEREKVVDVGVRGNEMESVAGKAKKGLCSARPPGCWGQFVNFTFQ